MLSKKINAQGEGWWEDEREGKDEKQNSSRSLAGKQHVTDLFTFGC